MKHPGSILYFPNDRDTSHSTQKPVALMEWLVRAYSNPGDLIIDPFCGSGTTGVACLKHNRRFIGIEREQKYFDTACQRIERAHHELNGNDTTARPVHAPSPPTILPPETPLQPIMPPSHHASGTSRSSKRL